MSANSGACSFGGSSRTDAPAPRQANCFTTHSSGPRWPQRQARTPFHRHDEAAPRLGAIRRRKTEHPVARHRNLRQQETCDHTRHGTPKVVDSRGGRCRQRPHRQMKFGPCRQRVAQRFEQGEQRTVAQPQPHRFRPHLGHPPTRWINPVEWPLVREHRKPVARPPPRNQRRRRGPVIAFTKPNASELPPARLR